MPTRCVGFTQMSNSLDNYAQAEAHDPLGENDSTAPRNPASRPLIPSPIAVMQQRQALPARHRGAIIGGDSFHCGPMCGFLVAGVTQNHAVLIQGVQVTSLSLVPGHRARP